MFYKDSRQVYRSSELDSLEWLVHGFGTRSSEIPRLFPQLATLRQVHSSDCVSASGLRGILGQGDALIENIPGAVIAVKTADCIPILLADARRHAVAAVHAGWRGAAAGVARHAVAAMRQTFGTDPADLHAAIGPGIGKCCYQVGPDVNAQFGGQGRGYLDLPDAIRRQLLETGIPPARIHMSNLCTMCLPAEFHSYRRDREAAGRMHSFIGIQPM